MTPRLALQLLADRIRKATKPALARELLDQIIPGLLVYHLPNVFHVRVAAGVVVDGRQLDHLAQERDGTVGPEVLVPDCGLGDGVRLVFRTSPLADDVDCFDAAVDIEGHAG